ncbi:MAG: hypothetical protein R3B57_11130 [Phycisphaerales bacterium]
MSPIGTMPTPLAWTSIGLFAFGTVGLFVTYIAVVVDIGREDKKGIAHRIWLNRFPLLYGSASLIIAGLVCMGITNGTLHAP